MNEKRPLFDASEFLSDNDRSPNVMSNTQHANAEHSLKVKRSALWAAYGDALGWISELTDEKGLKRRTSGASLEKPLKWIRRVGGPAGVNVSLPVGCYSDDSQLRLATCRAIRADGFDVEAFAKVELPVWLSYALGGGKSTSAAASNLVRPRAQWFANTFKDWTKSGGNGAAMRIQPHVWSATSPDDPIYLSWRRDSQFDLFSFSSQWPIGSPNTRFSSGSYYAQGVEAHPQMSYWPLLMSLWSFRNSQRAISRSRATGCRDSRETLARFMTYGTASSVIAGRRYELLLRHPMRRVHAGTPR